MLRPMLLSLFLPLLLAAQVNRLTESERRAGWRLLFDGETTDGWVEVTGKPFPSNCWTVEDGSLKALVRSDGFQDIRTRDSFDSFELEFDWKLLKNGNSGVKYLIQNVDEWTNKAGRQARARGLEYQLADDANEEALNPKQVAGALYSLLAPSPRIAPRIGAFNRSRLLVHGRHVEHWLNNRRVVQFEMDAPEVNELLRSYLPKGTPPGTALVRRSPISLQNHASEAWFRNIKLRPF
jgi:hypothetical protein